MSIGDENRTEALESYAAGVSVEDISEEMGVDEQTVYRWLSELDAVVYVRQRRDRKIVAAYLAEWTVDTIRATFKVTQPTMYNVLARYGVTPRRKRTKQSPEVCTGVVTDYMAGIGVSAIQRKYGISPPTMYNILHSNNVTLRTRSLVPSVVELGPTRDPFADTRPPFPGYYENVAAPPKDPETPKDSEPLDPSDKINL